MSYKIESITATIPVTGQSYTDLRPMVSADSMEDYREALSEVGKLAGNDAFINRMTNNKAGKEKICTDQGCLYLDRETHEYEDEDGNKFISGSTWAGQFEKPFAKDIVAKQVAETKLTTVEQVLAGWEMKGEVSCDYGSVVHKAVECAIKYNELPNNPHLLALAQDALDLLKDAEVSSEQFICSFEDRACGIVDCLVNLGNKRVKIVDFKTSDLDKKIQLTPEAKELWPELTSKLISIYHLQLSYYAYILTKMGYKVDSLEIWAESAEAWAITKLQPLDITKAIGNLQVLEGGSK